MIPRLDRRPKKRRDIDVNTVRADFIAAQAKYIGKGKRHDRPIMSGVGHFSLTPASCTGTPALAQRVLTGANCRKKPCDCGSYSGTSNCFGGISESESRVRSQKLHKASRVCRIDGREQSIPPRRIKQGLSYTASHHRDLIILNHRFSIRASPTTSLNNRG